MSCEKKTEDILLRNMVDRLLRKFGYSRVLTAVNTAIQQELHSLDERRSVLTPTEVKRFEFLLALGQSVEEAVEECVSKTPIII